MFEPAMLYGTECVQAAGRKTYGQKSERMPSPVAQVSNGIQVNYLRISIEGVPWHKDR